MKILIFSSELSKAHHGPYSGFIPVGGMKLKFEMKPFVNIFQRWDIFVILNLLCHFFVVSWKLTFVINNKFDLESEPFVIERWCSHWSKVFIYIIIIRHRHFQLYMKEFIFSKEFILFDIAVVYCSTHLIQQIELFLIFWNSINRALFLVAN